MASKNYKSELDDVFKKFGVFAKASQYLRHEEDKIAEATKASINQGVSAGSASGEERQELLSDAQENADKAADILLQLHHRLADDYGRFWRRDIITHQQVAIPEQEIVEAFSLLATLNQMPIPTRTINFRMREPDKYGKTRSTLTVSGEQYVFGLLDCVGEISRVIQNSLENKQMEFLKRIFKQMEELYTKLERFKEFPNRKDPKIQARGYAHMKAIFSGKCTKCTKPIQIGEEIVKNSKGMWVHDFCSDIKDEFPNRKDRRVKDYANLKHRIDTCAGQVHYCKKLLQDNGIL
jgi:predicted translin family RNA/ssDNA-binding protein|tara:strand:- start:76 stop:954 length:879 start_codon:yes stop_codon:yes gene_type:complete